MEPIALTLWNYTVGSGEAKQLIKPVNSLRASAVHHFAGHPVTGLTPQTPNPLCRCRGSRSAFRSK